MLVELPTGKFRIFFRHSNNGSSLFNYSECYIKDALGELVAWGQAICSPEDQFCYSKGRRISLERALDTGMIDFGFSKEDRKLIWAQYFKDHRDLERNNVKLLHQLVNSLK